MDYIKSKDLVALTECSKKYSLQLLSLKNGNERYLCISEAIRKMAEALTKGEEKDAIDRDILSFLESRYKEEWFSLTWQRDKAVKRDAELFRRFLYGFALTDGDWILANQNFRVELPLCCNEVEVKGVRGTATLVLEHADDSVTGIILCRKFKKPFSYRARKHENKVMNSLELLTMLGGLKNQYPDKEIKVMLVRLSAVSDKPDQLIDFEKKKGENIVSFTSSQYMEEHPEGVSAGIREAVMKAELCTCQGCIYEDICRPANKIFIKREKEEVLPDKGELPFSETQKKIICHQEGPLRVCAGPGSGKTAVLVGRIQKLINSGVPADKILAITFTKKAAQEMLDRIQAEDMPEISTLHALAFRILIKHEFLIGPVRLASMVDRKNLLLKVLNHAPLISSVSYEGITMRYGLITTLLQDFEFIEKKGADAYSASNKKKDVNEVMAVKELYDAAFRMAGYITFDAQIIKAVQLLKKYPGIRNSIWEKYQYVMVDEVQDLDAIQAEFVQLLVRPEECNLMICGDADQSIYSFRGGSNQFMLDFKQIFPQTEDIWLQKNYRSSEEIVNMASALIQNNKERVPMNLKACFSTGFQAIHITYFHNRKFPLLIQDILRKGYQYSDIAVIATTNNALYKLCEAVDAETVRTGIAIPVERPKFFLRDDYVFNMLLDLLELKIKGMNQDKALYRLLRGMGCELDKQDKSCSLYEDHVRRKLIYSFQGEEASRYYVEKEPMIKGAYGKIYIALQKLEKPLNQALPELMEYLIPQDMCIEEVLGKIGNMIYERKIKTNQQLYELLTAIKLFEDDTRVRYDSSDRNQVHMLTAHDSKGKEFPVVILYGVEDFERENVEEDRRLLYVAMTRSKRVLFLIENYPGKSQFLKEIIDYISMNRGRRYE